MYHITATSIVGNKQQQQQNKRANWHNEFFEPPYRCNYHNHTVYSRFYFAYIGAQPGSRIRFVCIDTVFSFRIHLYKVDTHKFIYLSLHHKEKTTMLRFLPGPIGSTF